VDSKRSTDGVACGSPSAANAVPPGRRQLACCQYLTTQDLRCFAHGARIAYPRELVDRRTAPLAPSGLSLRRGTTIGQALEQPHCLGRLIAASSAPRIATMTVRITERPHEPQTHPSSGAGIPEGPTRGGAWLASGRSAACSTRCSRESRPSMAKMSRKDVRSETPHVLFVGV
jgi:hypothetical protein